MNTSMSTPAAQALRAAATDLADTWPSVLGEPHTNVVVAVEQIRQWLRGRADRLDAEHAPAVHHPGGCNSHCQGDSHYLLPSTPDAEHAPTPGTRQVAFSGPEVDDLLHLVQTALDRDYLRQEALSQVLGWRDRLSEAVGTRQVTGQSLIAAERQRQVEIEGYTAEHDAEQGPWTLMRAAECYEYGFWIRWPWGSGTWKPKGPLSNLVRAGALYQAAADVSYILGPRQGVDRCADAIDLLLAEVRGVETDQ